MPKLPLRRRIALIIFTICAVNIAGAGIALWYISRTQDLYSSLINHNVNAMISAQNLESGLALQKGLTTYYYLSRDEKWLDRLQERDISFSNELNNARLFTDRRTDAVLDRLEKRHADYISSRNDIIRLYHQNKTEQGAEEHWQVREKFTEVADLCREFRLLSEEKTQKEKEGYKKAARYITVLTWSAILIEFMLVIILVIILFRQILRPLIMLAEGNGGRRPRENEIRAVERRVSSLLENIDETKSELKESREQLILSEKLALTGRLAAGVAHSVRNPLTSVKMRLFSLERSLDPQPNQKEDIDVIAEEIRHIDTIVQNFLEFSRPPKLKLRMVSPSDIVDALLILLKHRIDLLQLAISLERQTRLPETLVDPDQIKEALINIFMNACDAAGEKGEIVISERIVMDGNSQPCIRIGIRDNGSGIDEAIQKNIFQPFYTSKQEGSGLGLSISNRIIGEHYGNLSFETELEKGTEFIVTLPIRKEK